MKLPVVSNPLGAVFIVLICVIVLFWCFILSTYLWVACKWLKNFFKSRHLIIPLMKDPLSKVTYTELLRATDGFSTSHFIGAGSFGSVYMGFVTSIKAVVAIKVLNLQQQKASKSFVAECKALRNIRHRNIAKIVTICSTLDFGGNDFKALIFEFMPNGSLHRWLHKSINERHQTRCLTFIQRVNIAMDVACALDYLHHQCHEPVIHCNLKPSNVLLDKDMVAHVSDFGLAKELSNDKAKFSQPHSSSLLVGSIGYVPPEYGAGGEASTHGDIYSYGILLLEMFSGKEPGNEMFRDDFNLHAFAKMVLPERVMDFIDQRLLSKDKTSIRYNRPSIPMNSRLQEGLISMVKLGISCSEELPRERMTIRDVIMELHRIRDLCHSPVKHEAKKEEALLLVEGPSYLSCY